MRHLSFSSRQPRRGQALLLAVLIMIFAALLSASFIAVVSVNLNQTARQTDKNRAAASAKAGMDYINRQLAFSADGENWRPQTIALTDSNYGFYYSALDRAQGWAGDSNGDGNGDYAKFPDPLNVQGDNNGPQFLAKVERISYQLTRNDPEFDKAGSLKITIIGLSPEDPTAYSRTVFYKGGYQNAPIAQNMRVVSNWDFKNGVVPVGQAASYVASTRTVSLVNPKGEFPDPPFAVMIGDPRTNFGVRGAVVVTKTGTSTAPVFTFAYPGNAVITPSIKNDERIELAASIGAPNGLNYNNNAYVAPAPLPNPTPIATPVTIADASTAGGVRVNGGLWLTGQASSDALLAPVNAYGPTVDTPAAIQASGLFGRELTLGSPPSVTQFNVRGTAIAGANNDLLSSDVASFPGQWTTPTAFDRTTRDQLVSDGWNRLSGVPTTIASPGTATNPNSTGTRQVNNFIPPAIDTGEGLERYRNLTRFSPSLSGSPSTSLYGNGQGIYIDNVEDRERIYAGTALRDMTQTELVNMWVSRPLHDPLIATPTFLPPNDYMRTGAPLSPVSTTASLEQQHIRGWVGPDEFRARGVEIELVPGASTTAPATLLITRDSHDDGPTNVLGGVVAKTWKDQTTGASQSGVYTRAFPWPANGVVFAEGNVRIRGDAKYAPRSLTVVSMGNIYIEDSLNADDAADDVPNGVKPGSPRKVLLIAKKNVVMNPTRVLGRPDAQTIVTLAAPVVPAVGTTPATQTLTVPDGLAFKIGDYVQTFGATGTISGGGYVVAPAPTVTTINLSSVIGTIAPTDFVRTPSTIPQATAGTPYNAILSPDDLVQRRFNAASTNMRFAFNHGADRPTASIFGVKTSAAASSNVLLSHKRVVVGSAPTTTTTVSDLDKLIRGDYSAPTAGSDTFSTPAPTNQATANLQTLSTIAAAMNSSSHPPPGPTDWSYVATPNATYGAVPFFYLAGIGNRLEYGIPSTVIEKRATVNSTTTYDIPLATSINLWLTGTRPVISNEYWNGTTYDATTQFGFNPAYQDVSALPVTLPEDILTADRGFYQSDVTKSTLDSRLLPVAILGLNSLVFRQGENLIGISPPTSPLPAYRLRGLKAENVTLLTSSDTVATIAPAYTFNVNAFVYAQTGSWFIIPSGLFDDRLRGDGNQNYLDINNNKTADPGEYTDVDGSNTYTPGDFADLNRNGIVDDADRNAMARYSRYNYQINFNGAIAEDQTPIINTMKDDVPTKTATKIVANGAVEAWMLSTATITKTGAAVANGRMNYTFDSDYVRGRLVDDPTTPLVDETDTGFRLPQTTEIFSVTG